MFHSAEAIVLQLIPHKDHNAIVKIFTRNSGLTSCWVNSLHGKSSGIRVSGLQPLTIIQAIIDQRDNKQLATLKEMQIPIFLSNIRNMIEKNAIAIFMAELITHIIKEPAPDESLYDFLQQSIILLNNTNEKCSNFHIVFMMNLSTHLGFMPKNSFSLKTPYLNLEEGTYQATAPMNKAFFYPDESEYVSKLSNLEMVSFSTISMPSAMRKNILNGLLKYFEIHTGMSPLKSHLVLEEVF